jgi:hypothetical protein
VAAVELITVELLAQVVLVAELMVLQQTQPLQMQQQTPVAAAEVVEQLSQVHLDREVMVVLA